MWETMTKKIYCISRNPNFLDINAAILNQRKLVQHYCASELPGELLSPWKCHSQLSVTSFSFFSPMKKSVTITPFFLFKLCPLHHVTFSLIKALLTSLGLINKLHLTSPLLSLLFMHSETLQVPSSLAKGERRTRRERVEGEADAFFVSHLAHDEPLSSAFGSMPSQSETS